jgi:hypothetical protein
MRKRMTNRGTQNPSPTDERWLDLECLAQVEVTSEDAEHPIESALIPAAGVAWRAAQSGQQTVRLFFDERLKVRRIRLVFDEHEQRRTHEFVVRWSSDGGRSYREVVRQQYNFSPPGTNREFEDYAVDLDGLTALEVSIVPDISGALAYASITQLRLA